MSHRYISLCLRHLNIAMDLDPKEASSLKVKRIYCVSLLFGANKNVFLQAILEHIDEPMQ